VKDSLILPLRESPNRRGLEAVFDLVLEEEPGQDSAAR
jgi:hypothetical protein